LLDWPDIILAFASGTLVFIERAFPCKSTNLISGFCSSFEEQPKINVKDKTTKNFK
jgi:hypothetical protein